MNDMDNGYLQRLLGLLVATVCGLAICAMITALCSCKSTKYVTVPEYHTVYKTKTDSVVKHDSVWQHDSVYVWEHGGIKYKYREKLVNNYKYIDRLRVDTLLKTDSIEVPVPVERELGWWEQTKVDYFMPIAWVCVILLLSLLWIIRKRRNAPMQRQDDNRE